MYVIKNKYSKLDALTLQWSRDAIVNRETLELNQSWKNFLTFISKYEIDDRNWNIVLKLYEGVVVNEGDWVVMNNEGSFFPLNLGMLKSMYELVDGNLTDL